MNYDEFSNDYEFHRLLFLALDGWNANYKDLTLIQQQEKGVLGEDVVLLQRINSLEQKIAKDLETQAKKQTEGEKDVVKPKDKVSRAN